MEEMLQKFEMIFRHIDNGITVQNPQGRVVFVNDKAAKMTGYPNREKMMEASEKGELFDSISMWSETGEPFPIEELPSRLALANKKPHKNTIRFVNKKNGKKENWSQIMSVPIMENGKLVYVVNTITDVTEEKKRQARAGYFIAMAVHEFKTPLADIRAISQLVSRNVRAGNFENIQGYVDKAINKVDSLTFIINNFLNTTKVVAGKLEIEPEEFDYNDFLQEMVTDLRRVIKNHTIEIKGKLKKKIVQDKNRLAEILINLTINASKYSPVGTEITIEVKTDGKFFSTCVRDRGTGIEKKYYRAVFEPFNSIPGADSNLRGLGIGLFLSAQLSRMMGGKIWVDSKIDLGSRFCFRLPYKSRRKFIKFKDI